MVRRIQSIRVRLRTVLSSYRLRVLAWFVGLLALGTVATVVVVGEVLLEGTDERIRTDLIQESQEFGTLVNGSDPETGQPFGPDVGRIFDVFLDRNVPARNEVILTFVDGEFHRRSRPEPHVELQLEPEFVSRVATVSEPVNGRHQTTVGGVDYLAVPVNVDGTTRGVFVVAAFRDLQQAEADDILRAVSTVGLVLLIIGSVLAWRLADRVLAPVRRTAATARSITETDLEQRVEVRGHDEVADLAQTFNEMLDRVSAAIGEQRRFMADAGHELRTPLTVARGHLELADQQDPEDLGRTIDLVLDEIDRMTRLVNELTLLAAATRPDFVRRSEMDAGDLIATVFEKARVLAERDWQVVVGQDVSLSADRQRLTQAMLQLAQNAVQHTESGQQITLGADADDGHVRLWVRDAGEGIEPSEQHEVFRRFYRGKSPGDHGASGHTGLGLSIVSAIAEAHGGTVELASAPGSGATFTLVIPRRIPTPISNGTGRSRDHGAQHGDPIAP
jgi:signal transduction histidine kinase